MICSRCHGSANILKWVPRTASRGATIKKVPCDNSDCHGGHVSSREGANRDEAPMLPINAPDITLFLLLNRLRDAAMDVCGIRRTPADG